MTHYPLLASPQERLLVMSLMPTHWLSGIEHHRQSAGVEDFASRVHETDEDAVRSAIEFLEREDESDEGER